MTTTQQPQPAESAATIQPGPGRPPEATTALAAPLPVEASLRPSAVCAYLLRAMGASEGRRKRRKRDTTPDAIGLGIKRDLLEGAVEADPDPDDFEGWLLEQCLGAGPLAGATRAMAIEVRDEWLLAVAAPGFRDWLAAGAPSDDTKAGPDRGLDPRRDGPS